MSTIVSTSVSGPFLGRAARSVLVISIGTVFISFFAAINLSACFTSLTTCSILSHVCFTNLFLVLTLYMATWYYAWYLLDDGERTIDSEQDSLMHDMSPSSCQELPNNITMEQLYSTFSNNSHNSDNYSESSTYCQSRHTISLSGDTNEPHSYKSMFLFLFGLIYMFGSIGCFCEMLSNWPNWCDNIPDDVYIKIMIHSAFLGSYFCVLLLFASIVVFIAYTIKKSIQQFYQLIKVAVIDVWSYFQTVFVRSNR